MCKTGGLVRIVDVSLTRHIKAPISFKKLLVDALCCAGIDQINIRNQADFELATHIKRRNTSKHNTNIFLVLSPNDKIPDSSGLIDGVVYPVFSLNDLSPLKLVATAAFQMGLQLELMVGLGPQTQGLVEGISTTLLQIEQEILLCLVDNSGLVNPEIVYGRIRSLDLPPMWKLGIQASDRFGLGVSNSIGAVLGGARFVHVSATYSPFAAHLAPFALAATRLGGMRVTLDHRQLLPIERLCSSFYTRTYSLNEPVTGRYSLSHVAGLHTTAVVEQASTYEPFEPKSVGCSTTILDRILLGKLSGRRAVAYVLEKRFGCRNHDIVEKVFGEIKRSKKVSLAELSEIVGHFSKGKPEDSVVCYEKQNTD